MGLLAGEQILSKILLRSSRPVSPWCNSRWKRGWDVAGAIVLLILLFPFMLIIATAVWCTSRGPVLFRQRRTGKDREEFYILKFRTMITARRQQGEVFTRPADPRITPLGRILRKWKIDEFPQLFNVLRGEMSFVGPRPLVTQTWEEPCLLEEAVTVLSVRPGITSDATLNFRNEEAILAAHSFEDQEEAYMKAIMPLKLEMEIEYLKRATFQSDWRIVLQTVFRVVGTSEGPNLLRTRSLPATMEPQYAPVVNQKREYSSAADRAD
jgi:lipopolysaccharide/colanic/teichoic acid biosynthesis glycosyltransferase